MRKYYCGVLRRHVPKNTVAITGTLRLNRFTLLYIFNSWFALSRNEKYKCKPFNTERLESRK